MKGCLLGKEHPELRTISEDDKNKRDRSFYLSMVSDTFLAHDLGHKDLDEDQGMGLRVRGFV